MRAWFLAAAAAAVCLAISAGAAHADVDLSKAEIVLSAGADRLEVLAARELQRYLGLIGAGRCRIGAKADGARNYTQCDSLLIGSTCGAHTVPYVENRNPTAVTEHEATTSKISEDQLFYCRQRGMSQEEAVSLIVNGFCREVLQTLPMEFAVEAQKLVGISLEGSVG